MTNIFGNRNPQCKVSLQRSPPCRAVGKALSGSRLGLPGEHPEKLPEHGGTAWSPTVVQGHGLLHDSQVQSLCQAPHIPVSHKSLWVATFGLGGQSVTGVWPSE